MARNKFLKRMAVTALAASMTLGTVPAVAMNVFAETKVTSQAPSSSDTATASLYSEVDAAVKTLDKNAEISTATTGDKIAEALKNALETADPSSSFSVDVTVDSTDTAKYVNATTAPTAPVINATAKVQKYDKATIGTQPNATEAIAAIDNVTFTLDCGKLTDLDYATVEAGYYADEIKSGSVDKLAYTFANVASVSSTPIKTKLDALTTAAKANTVLAPYFDSVSIGTITTAIQTQPTDDVEGTVAVTIPVTHTTAKTTTTAATDATVTISGTAYISRTSAAASTVAEAQKVIESVELTNDQVEDTYAYSKDAKAITAISSTLKGTLQKKLDDAGITGVTISDVTIAKDSSNKSATHAANGSVKVSVTYHADADKSTANDVTSIETLTIVHGDADIQAEAHNAVDTALKALKKTDFQAKDATTAPSKDDVKKVITDAVDKALADKLGGTATIASELYSEKAYILSAFDYTPATTEATGSVSATVSLLKAHEATSKSDTTKYDTFDTISLSPVVTDKLSTKVATGISLGADIDTKGAASITPEFSPDGANCGYVKLSWKGDTKLDKATVNIISADGTTTANITRTADGASSGIFTITAGQKIQIVNGYDDGADTEDWKDIEGTLTATLYDARDNKLATDSVNVSLSKLFKDVTDATKFYFEPVYKLTAKEVVKGTTASTYSPERNVTRGDFITLLYRAAKAAKKVTGTVNAEDASEKFSDVSSKDYYAEAIAWAVDNKIASGTSDSTFSPTKTITRADAVTFLARYDGVKVTTGDDYAIHQFDDVKSGAYYTQAVLWAYYNGITAGKTSKVFAPNDKVTRGQAAAFIERYFKF
ncbi:MULTISPECIES: S-layer homology domain-containing protein [unclassified Bilifractor]|uniref:S-layer homology domain-containing protein n=1 Tax=unclassified Bilifractor TaxID=2815795 RepID=UPI003F8DDC5F